MRRLISLLIIVLLSCNFACGGFGGFLQANTAVDVIVGPFIDDTDGKTAETGLTVTQAEVRLSKNGANMAQKTEATSLTHDELGNYVCKLDATDTDTEGILTLMVHESGALAVKIDYQILAQAAYISLMTAKDTGYMGVDVEEVDGTDQTGNDNGADINTIVTTVGNIETDTAAYDTDAEYATAIWNALTNAYGGAGTYGQVAEDTLVDTSTTLDDFIDTEISTIVTAVGNIETDTAAQDTAGEWDTLMATVDGKLDTAQADLDTITGASGVLIDTDAVDADALKTDAVTEIWAQALSDLAAGAPSATASVLTGINYLYEAWRNGYKTDGTNSEIVLYKDDGTTPLVEADIADDGTDFTRQEYGAPD